jgi:hypothetical protein
MSEKLGLRVQLLYEGSAGQIRIHFRNLDQLDSLIQMLSPN